MLGRLSLSLAGYFFQVMIFSVERGFAPTDRKVVTEPICTSCLVLITDPMYGHDNLQLKLLSSWAGACESQLPLSKFLPLTLCPCPWCWSFLH